MNSLIWKLYRLSAMRPSEILYRVQQALQSHLEKYGVGLAKASIAQGQSGKAWLNELPREFEIAQYCVAADSILTGRFNVFSLKNVELGCPPQWNRDPKTGITAPHSFGKLINYRDDRVVGDIKYLWEPNRHAELVTLAQAWRLTSENKYLNGCQKLLDSWFEQCPYPLGINWTSSLEHGIRLVNWSVAWHLLGGEASLIFEDEQGQAFKRRWLESIYQHCFFIAGYFSKHSSANNHLLGELMGLLVGSMTWPLWPESRGWRQLAHRLFEAEALKQTAEDGVNREQALWYHHEVADMMLISGLFARANGQDFSAEFWKRLEAMLEFIASMLNVAGAMPMIGDSDEAMLVQFSREPDFDVYSSLLATGAVLFGRGDFKLKAKNFDDKSRWLLGDASASQFDALTVPATEAPKQSFPLGGYYLLGKDFGAADEVKLIADCGPLGYLAIAAHGHADALAFTLSAAGEMLLIDPGTYAYHTQKEWRDYFRSTQAHNTLCVDGQDQSVIGGNFMWLKHAQAKLETWEPGIHLDRLVGSHDGYLRLSDPVLHRREIIFDKLTNHIKIFDTLNCKGRHHVALHWHCHEQADIKLRDSTVIIGGIRAKVTMSFKQQGFSVRVARGEESPPLGWVSRSFDIKIPAPVVVWSGEIQGSCSLETSLQINLEK